MFADQLRIGVSIATASLVFHHNTLQSLEDEV